MDCLSLRVTQPNGIMRYGRWIIFIQVCISSASKILFPRFTP